MFAPPFDRLQNEWIFSNRALLGKPPVFRRPSVRAEYACKSWNLVDGCGLGQRLQRRYHRIEQRQRERNAQPPKYGSPRDVFSGYEHLLLLSLLSHGTRSE